MVRDDSKPKPKKKTGYRVERSGAPLGFAIIADESRPTPRWWVAALGCIAALTVAVLLGFLIFHGNTNDEPSVGPAVVWISRLCISVFSGLMLWWIGHVSWRMTLCADSIIFQASKPDRRRAFYDIVVGSLPFVMYCGGYLASWPIQASSLGC